ncbi:hypothetical protein ACFT4A_41880 [Streptomyces sp. NPDC057099]|uniref:hypothetical protein n=1 Tax=Streptomyces sp. NPDC057099 TaxID=3346019 RepID=UPI003645D5B0
MTARRTLGSGPQDKHGVRAAHAGLLSSLPGVRHPDLDELRTRGVLGVHPATALRSRRALGAGGRADDDPAHTPG